MECILYLWKAPVSLRFINSANFSIRFWRHYVSLFASIALLLSLLWTSDRKSSRWTVNTYNHCEIYDKINCLNLKHQAFCVSLIFLLAEDTHFCVKFLPNWLSKKLSTWTCDGYDNAYWLTLSVTEIRSMVITWLSLKC